MNIYFWLAVILMISGHICKMFRWRQIIGTYEEAEESDLLQALAIGQSINMLVPFRVGDVCRVFLAGKKLKNGYALSMASVIADIYADLLTVGIEFAVLFFLSSDANEIKGITATYCLLSVFVLAATGIAIKLKKYIKRIIQKTAAVFNDKLEMGILYTAYLSIASIKNMFKHVNIFKYMLYTVGIWGSYFASYGCFAKCMRLCGYNISIVEVFKTIFSFAGSSWIRLCIRSKDTGGGLVQYLIYMMLPLLLIYIFTIINKAACGNGNRSYRFALPQLNASDKLVFLEIYFGEEQREYVEQYLTMNRDVSVIMDCSAGSNATTILCMNDKGTFYRKYAFGQEASKLSDQVKWIETYQNKVPCAVITDMQYGETYFSYDMKYTPGAVGFFQYIHSVPLENSWSILHSLLKLLEVNVHSENRRPADEKTIKEYIDKKIVTNIGVCKNGGKYLKDLAEYEILNINGVDYPNLRSYHDILNRDTLASIFRDDTYAAIHGDLTIENIVCEIGGDGETPYSFYLIDPNTNNLHESPYLDYAKILQSLHGGYEFLVTVTDVDINGNEIRFLITKSAVYNMLYQRYREYLYEVFTERELKSIYFHEIAHWFRLMPYKIRKDEKKAVVFYAEMLIILQDIRDMFYSQEEKTD